MLLFAKGACERGNVVDLPLLADQLAFALFLGCSVGYHVYYVLFTRHHPSWSIRARMHQHRLNWVESIQKRGERIMAVQALRNLIMTNTFLASTMLLLLAFIANFVVTNPSRSLFGQHAESLLYGGTPISLKGVVLMILYAFAFVMFLTSLRTLNHLSLLVGVDSEQMRSVEDRDPTHFLATKLNQVESMSTYGRRAVYFSLPVLAWFHSPWMFALLTLAIFAFFVLAMDFVQPFRIKNPQPGGKAEESPSTQTRPSSGGAPK